MSLFLEAAEDAAIFGSSVSLVFGLLALGAVFNNPFWKEPEIARQAATEAHYVVRDASRYAWFGCTEINPFSLYQTRFAGTDAEGRNVEGVVCRSAFSSENQVVVTEKVQNGSTESQKRTVTPVRIERPAAASMK